MKTNRQMAVLAALGCAVLGGGTALAVKGPGDGGIRNTPHDFSQYTWQFDPAGGAAQGQMCVPCHTPHKSNPYGFTPVSGSLPPLWNHQLKDGSAYTLSTFAGPGKANLNIKSLLSSNLMDRGTFTAPTCRIANSPIIQAFLPSDNNATFSPAFIVTG